MKKRTLFFMMMALAMGLHAQDHYWVMLTDKAGTTFDPYTYFDGKAIERYRQCGADLYDVSNYPLNASYVSQVEALVTDAFGQSRWLNAVAVTATAEQIAAVEQLPFVQRTVLLGGRMQTARHSEPSLDAVLAAMEQDQPSLHRQLQRMGGKYFRSNNIDGKGIRIAVLDGGFPQVNTHIAFKHLRDNHQIIKTWNFPDKKEDVYGWNSHGLMTLSCIVGRQGNMDLGLATGAEILLARTEIEAEPFKEEVWWQMGMEWADQNGAQIISSSLGYGKDRYYTKDMDGTSYVAKAGNLAARKGILVCNSAGNEGSDKRWRTIITPADADSVLCVGGIYPSLQNYELSDFSSYGPSADGRQKPNVCAFAYAWTANTGGDNDQYHQVPGTSFSCPLVAGFAACALQSHPELTAMQLFHELERSADLYPYCDYSYGYGVPQADYFTGDRKTAQPTFTIQRMPEGNASITLLTDNIKTEPVFVKNCRPDGSIIDYDRIKLSEYKTDMSIEVRGANRLVVHYNGYTDSILLTGNPTDQTMSIHLHNTSASFNHKQHYTTRLRNEHRKFDFFMVIGTPINTSGDEMDHTIWSTFMRVGIRGTHNFSKAYALGVGVMLGTDRYRLGSEIGSVDETLYLDALADAMFRKLNRHRIDMASLGIELFQRIRLRPCGIFHHGWHWDLGVYGEMASNSYRLRGTYKGYGAKTGTFELDMLDALKDSRFTWGVSTRITRDWIGLYARFRLSDLGKELAPYKLMLPRLDVGLQLMF